MLQYTGVRSRDATASTREPERNHYGKELMMHMFIYPIQPSMHTVRDQARTSTAST